MKLFKSQNLIDEKAKTEIELYKKRMSTLLENKLDYNLLQELIDKCKDDTVIDLTLSDGTRMVIRREKQNKESFYDYV